MKRSNFTLKLAGGLVFTAVLVWLAIYLAQALDNPYRTVNALGFTMREAAALEGIVVRDEEVLRSAYEIVNLSAEEGKRVTVGAAVAEAFDDEASLRRAVRRAELEAELHQITEQLESPPSASDMLHLEADIEADIHALRTELLRRTLGKLDERILSLQTKVLTATGTEQELRARLRACREELDGLQEPAGGLRMTVKAPASGLFSRAVDGFEDLRSAGVSVLSASELEALLAETRSAPADALGKLVYGSDWYYAALIGRKDAERLAPGQTVTVRFGRYFGQTVRMRVDRLGMSEGELRPILLSCNTDMTEVLGMRKQPAEMIFSEEEGLRIPRQGLRVDEEGRSCVYVQTGLQAEKKLVTVCRDYDDFYVVTSEQLRVGDEVIVSAKNLYDGKVVG